MLHIVVWLVLGWLQPDAADAEHSVFSALESIHAALAIMTNPDMPKQLYREEVRTFWIPSYLVMNHIVVVSDYKNFGCISLLSELLISQDIR